jgi:hypothetical protein
MTRRSTIELGESTVHAAVHTKEIYFIVHSLSLDRYDGAGSY